MNLADSLKHVLKHKSQHILSDFWNRDLKIILTSFSNDISQLYKTSSASLKNIRQGGVKFSFKEVSDSLTDAFLIIKVLPGRIKEAFIFFKDDLLQELENQSDAKSKAIFSFKILGALTSFTLGIIYNVKRGQTEFNLKGLKRRNAFTKFIVAELVFKITQHFLQRFLQELEKDLTEPEDLKNVKYFRQLLNDRVEIPEDEDSDETGDKSIEMVEEFRNYILTGKRNKLQDK